MIDPRKSINPFRAFLDPVVVDGFLYFMREIDRYKDDNAKANSDQQLLESALNLYKQGRINKDQFLDICAALCSKHPIQATEDKEVNLLFEEIEKRKNR